MSRLPFDPDRRSHKSKTAADARALSVSEVSAMVKTALATALPAKIRVVGEVSNFSDRTHWFFSLKDDTATLRAVCFASAARRVGFALKDGLQVVATGRIDYYDAQGQIQLYVDKIEPVGEGALDLQFRALCEQLRKLGYFDPERKKGLPGVPQTVAVVTSRTGAALQDVINTANQRWAGCRLLLLDVHVQGAAAAPEIAAAIDALSAQAFRLAIDVIILTRGGGSIEDLWAFNERIVADAVYRCAIPIVAAIGHETDTTIAELVADVRCATPTQAAVTVVPDAAALAHQLDQLHRRLGLVVRRSAEHARHTLAGWRRHPVFARPDRLAAPVRERLTTVADRLVATSLRRASSARDKLDALGRQLAAIGPSNVLHRGYSYTLDPAGRVLRRALDVAAGDRITTVLSEGQLASRVENGATSTPRRRTRGPRNGEPGLFA